MPSFLRTSVSPSPNLECSLNKTFYDATWALKWHCHSHFTEGETKALRTEARLKIPSKFSNFYSSDLSHLLDWGNTKKPGIQLMTQPDAEKKKNTLSLLLNGGTLKCPWCAPVSKIFSQHASYSAGTIPSLSGNPGTSGGLCELMGADETPLQETTQITCFKCKPLDFGPLPKCLTWASSPSFWRTETTPENK